MLDIQKMIEALMPVFNWTGLWMVSLTVTYYNFNRLTKVWPNQNLDTVPLNSKSNQIFSFFANINQINILLQKINTSYWWILICKGIKWLPLVKLIWPKLNRKEASKPTLNPKPIFTRLTKAQDLPKCHKLNLINRLT